MPVYNEKIFIYPLTWQNIFHGPEDFIEKINAVDWYPPEPEHLYDVLAIKYVLSKTRYVNEIPFILALKRALLITWPNYIRQKELLEHLKAISIDEVTLRNKVSAISAVDSNRKGLNNEVIANDDPVVNADTVAIKDKSTRQISDKSEGSEYSSSDVVTVTNKLQAINDIYDSLEVELLNKVYAKTDKLFRQILIDEFDIAPFEEQE